MATAKFRQTSPPGPTVRFAIGRLGHPPPILVVPAGKEVKEAEGGQPPWSTSQAGG